jgi:LPXTG-motif cell wall-anchored protein
MTRSRDNVPRWLDRLLVAGLAAVLAVCALALYVVAASSPANATDGCVGNPDYCEPEETDPTWPNTTEPNPSTSSSPPSSGPSTTSPASQPTSTTTSPTSSSSAPTTSTQPSSTVSVAPPPVPPTTCAPDPDRTFGPDCTIDPCVIDTLGYWSDDYAGGHLAGGDHGYTRYHAWHCTVPTTAPTGPTTHLPVTGSNGSTMSLVALGLLAAGTALVAASRRRHA